MQKTEFVNTSADTPRAPWQTPEVMVLGRVADLAHQGQETGDANDHQDPVGP